MKTAVLGIGNPVLGDDCAGLEAAAVLRGLLAAEPVDSVEVLTTSNAGLDIIELLTGYARAILIDSITVEDPHPGRIHHLFLADANTNSSGQSAHEISLTGALRLAARLGIPMPDTIELYAIEAADTTTLTETMTPQVVAAAGSVASAIHAALKSPQFAGLETG